MVDEQLNEYKQQVVANMIALSKATSNELDTKIETYSDRIRELETRL